MDQVASASGNADAVSMKLPAFQARARPTPDFAIGFWQSWRYEVQIVNSEIRQWRPAR
jgi:hypothetical protein